MFKVVFDRCAIKDARKLKSAGLADRAKSLLKLLETSPYQQPPFFERLVGNLSGLFSRRINIQHRLVYQIDHSPFVENGVDYEGTIRVLRMWTHYEKMPD